MIRDIARFRSAYHSSSIDHDHTAHLTTADAPLSWISGGSGEEWLAVDLGASSRIDAVQVCWGETYARRYTVQLSEDGKHWIDAASAHGAKNAAVETTVDGQAAWVRILCGVCSDDHYVIDKIHVFGENGFVASVPCFPAPEADGTQRLTGGNWRICRAEQAMAVGGDPCRADFDDSAWLPATVPGTALVSYLNAGAVPDIYVDDNQYQISEAYFNADFWYRTHFATPAEWQGRRVFLNFDAINWKADIYFNGAFLPNTLPDRPHSIEGAFIRASFDVTEHIRFKEENCLAVLVHANDTPGELTPQGLAEGPGINGGKLGADNPTIHASVGWDWLPTIPGRDMGLYGDVYLRCTGDLRIEDPWMQTDLELLSESTGNPARDLMQGEGVQVDGAAGPWQDWRGKEGDSFTIDLGNAYLLGGATLIWGTEAVGGAADLESRQAEQFRLERSVDGRTWENFDAYPGGNVELRFFGSRPAEPCAGSSFFAGHSGSDSVQGGTAVIQLDLSMFGRGMQEQRIFAPQPGRYLRFTVLHRRELNGSPVDTIVHDLRVYEQSPEQVEQGMVRHYELDTSKAALTFRAGVRNFGNSTVNGSLQISVEPGGLHAELPMEMKPGEVLQPEIHMVLDEPRLWWPNTYGESFLYTCTVRVLADGRFSEEKSFLFGVRRFDYPISGGLLTLYCNGVRILCKGGNWGLDEGLKRDTAITLFDKIRLHAEANMTMIRNWVGMTGHPAFYEACDRYGILIWDDFWLANPFDGPEPNDPDMFLANAADKIRAVRGHAALALYCGRNEGNPPPALNAGLEKLTRELDGTRLYIPHSAAAPVGSGGGYALAMPGGGKGIKQYFNDVSSTVIRSERGIPNVPELTTMRRFLRPENLWPISESWALHDWTYHSNGPANTYMNAVQSYLGSEFDVAVDKQNPFGPRSEEALGAYRQELYRMCAEAAKVWTVEDFSRAAQLINYDNHRGMFDALGVRQTNGLLMWMSQSSWPSFMWQTYDYYLDVNGGYFGCKAGCQPTRAIFDPRDNGIYLANATPNRYEKVTVLVELFELNGKDVYSKRLETDVLEPDAYGIFAAAADFSAAQTEVVFLRLTLLDQGGTVLGRNTYWHNRNVYQDYRALSTLPEAGLTVKLLNRETLPCSETRFTFEFHCESGPALAVSYRLADGGGNTVLPVFYSDNYLMMMPGDRMTVTATVSDSRLPAVTALTVKGWNVSSRLVAIENN